MTASTSKYLLNETNKSAFFFSLFISQCVKLNCFVQAIENISFLCSPVDKVS